jgi:hypothetical protein
MLFKKLSHSQLIPLGRIHIICFLANVGVIFLSKKYLTLTHTSDYQIRYHECLSKNVFPFPVHPPFPRPNLLTIPVLKKDSGRANERRITVIISTVYNNNKLSVTIAREL